MPFDCVVHILNKASLIDMKYDIQFMKCYGTKDKVKIYY